MAEIEGPLQEISRDIQNELADAARLKADPETALADHQRMVREALEKAKRHYKKKDYPRAFGEFEKVCAALPEEDPFRRRIRDLKEAHANLIKANEELSQIRSMIAQRSAPSAADVKYAGQAHDAVSAQVKNIYSSMSRELRTERVPRSLSFWWPVALSLATLSIGAVILNGERAKIARERTSLAAQAEPIPVSPVPPKPSPMEETYEQAQRRVLERQIEALNRDHQVQLEGLKRKHAEDAKEEREKMIRLETRVKELEAENGELERRAQALFEDNVNKDRALSNLS